MANNGSKLKVLYLIDILTNRASKSNPMSAADISNEMNRRYDVTVDRKTVYDTIECMNELGYDIVHTRTPKNGYYVENHNFDSAEIFLLIDAVRTAKFITEKKTLELISRLEEMTGGNQQVGSIRGTYIDGNRKTKNEEILDNIRTIDSAIKSGEKITFSYGKIVLGDNRQIVTEYKTYTVSPYAMTWQDDNYYLICNYNDYDHLRNLRVDRMHSVKKIHEKIRDFKEVSEYVNTFDVADYTQKSFSMFGGEVIEIRLRCIKSILEQVFERFGDDITILNVQEDTFDFYVHAAKSDALVTWLINYIGRIEVIRPEALRQMVAERGKKILDIYK